jgi:hypothetical protein
VFGPLRSTGKLTRDSPRARGGPDFSFARPIGARMTL